MEVGESTKVMVAARPVWNDTGVMLVSGQTFRLSADGQWVDWYISCGPAGYSSPNVLMRLAERTRRAPAQQWLRSLVQLRVTPLRSS